MTVSIKHAFTSPKADGADTTLVQPSNWNAEHSISLAAGKVLGRDTSGAGAVQELPIAVDASGNVGVGTTSPNGLLHLASASPTFYMDETDQAVDEKKWRWNAAGKVLYLQTTNDAVSAAENAYQIVRGTGVAVDRHVWFTGATERMRIDSAGNVGIGTSSPGYKLDVGSFSTATTQTLRVAAATANDSQIKLMEAADSYGFTIRNANGAGLNILRHSADATGVSALFIGRDTGNVGVATSSPQAALHVNGDVIMQNGVYFEMTAPATKSAAATLTGAEVVGGYLQYTGAGATLTLPTAENLQAAMPTGVATLNDIAFDFTIINTGSGTATLAVNTGITAVGALTTATNTSTTFHIRKTATNTFIVYRT